MSSATPNNNGLWAHLIVEELVRLGCTMFFVSPGSRSSPLVQEIGRNPRAQSVIHYDERGSSFAALGYSRLSGMPAVWVTTSGTAVANGLPAVVESSTDRVPLILLTADRPPELRDTGANQTIRQPGIFGNHVRWQFDLPAPTDEIDPSFVLTTIDQAVFQSKSRLGPVHFNCMFREPLAYAADSNRATDKFPVLQEWNRGDLAYTSYTLPEYVAQACDKTAIADLLTGSKRPLMVLGRLSEIGYAESALAWAEQQGVPVFSDILSGFRMGRSEASIIHYADLILASAPNMSNTAGQPDVIIQLGKTPVSKRVLTYVQQCVSADYVVIDEAPDRLDPHHRVSHRLQLSQEGVEDLFSGFGATAAASEWMNRWQRWNSSVQDEVNRCIGETPEIITELVCNEQAVVRSMSSCMPAGHVLTVASSLPIRHLDSFASSTANPIVVVANRGASGIDGTIATSVGARLATAQPTTCLVGDLALLHDLNSLQLAADHAVIVVVINNDGGGIFSYLPINEQNDVFETFFGTPHGRSFEGAARMFDLTYSRVTTTEAFDAVYRNACSEQTAALIEVHSSRMDTKRVNDELISRIEALFGDEE